METRSVYKIKEESESLTFSEHYFEKVQGG